MLKKINTESHLYKLMDKYSIKEKYNELYKRNLLLIKDFANIQNINLLNDFCKKYKTNKEELSKIDFLINTIDYNRTEDIQIINIKLLALLTNNHFMLDWFLKEDSEFYNKPLGININRNNSNMTSKDVINLCCHFYNAFYSEINNSDSVLKRYLKSALDIFKENNNQIQFFVEIVINYLNKSIIEDENILESLDIMLEKKIKYSSFNCFIEEKASNFIGNKKTFEKMCEIVDFNIFNDKCLLEMLKNEDYFEKALNKFGYKKLDKIYSLIYNAKQLNKYRTATESNDNLQEIIINTSSINISNKINILEILEKNGELKNIINKDNQFLNRIFLESKSNRILTQNNYNFLDYLILIMIQT